MSKGAISVQTKSKQKDICKLWHQRRLVGWMGDLFHLAEYQNLELKGEEGSRGNRMIETCPCTWLRLSCVIEFPCSITVNLVNRKGGLELLPTPPVLHQDPQSDYFTRRTADFDFSLPQHCFKAQPSKCHSSSEANIFFTVGVSCNVFHSSQVVGKI